MPMRRPDFSRRVAVTGLGIISPIGQDIDTAWDNLVNGRSGLQADHPLGPDALRGAGRGRGQRLRRHAVDGLQGHPPHRPQRGHGRRRGQAGARRLRARGRRRQPRRHRRHLRLGRRRSATCSWRTSRSGETNGARTVSARSSSPTCCPTRRPARSPSRPASAARTCASSRPARRARTTSARRPRASGAATTSRRITGATENPLHEMVHIGFSTCAAWACRGRARPLETVSRPFDKTRNGFVLGEGAGALMLEDLEYAKARGAKVYAEVVGYGSAADAWDLIQPVEKGDGARRAMRPGARAPRRARATRSTSSTRTARRRRWATCARRRPSGPSFGDHTPDIAIIGHQVDDRPPDGRRRARSRASFTVLSRPPPVRAGDAQLPRRGPGDRPRRRPRRRRGRWRSATR